ncbi:unnamed protein product [Amoebophrya sp. A120]|nr:unnamed protein product [Amoebophrya sp. A120]|eukprot:GSA120T00020242001.1
MGQDSLPFRRRVLLRLCAVPATSSGLCSFLLTPVCLFTLPGATALAVARRTALATSAKLDPTEIDEIKVSPEPPSVEEVSEDVQELTADLHAAKAENLILKTSTEVSNKLAEIHKLQAEFATLKSKAEQLQVANELQFEKIYKIAERTETVYGAEIRKIEKPLAKSLKAEQVKATTAAIRADRDDLGKVAAGVKQQIVARMKSVVEGVKKAEEAAVEPVAAAKKEEARSVVDFWVRAKNAAKQVGVLKKTAIRAAKQAQLYAFYGRAYDAKMTLNTAHELMKQADALKVEAIKYQHVAEQLNGNVGTIAAAEAAAKADAGAAANPFGFDTSGADVALPDLPSAVEFAEEAAASGSGSAAGSAAR